MGTRLGWTLLIALSATLLPSPVRAANSRQYVDLALSSTGQPRIVAFDEELNKVRLAKHDVAPGWDCYVLSDAPGMGGNDHRASGSDGTAVVDAAGVPYVAYSVYKRLWVEDPSSCGNVSWVERVQLWLQKGPVVSAANQVCIDSSGAPYHCVNFSYVGIRVRLVRTPDGRIHSAYLRVPDGLRYAVSDPAVTSFTSEPVAPAALDAPGHISLAVDAAGKPHIGFIRSGRYFYVVKSATGWVESELSVPAYPSGYAGRPVSGISLALDGSGLASIAFAIGDSVWCSRETAPMVFATAELVSTAGYEGGWPSLARESNGDLHVGWLGNCDCVRYAKRAAGLWSAPVEIASHFNPIGPFPGRRLVIALTPGASPLPRIAYPSSDPDGGRAVWLAMFDGSAWTTNRVIPCQPPPPPDGGGGGGGHDPYEEGAGLQGVREDGPVTNGLRLSLPLLQRGSIRVSASLSQGEREFTLEVLDVAGRVLGRTRGVNDGTAQTLTFSDLPAPGIYLIRLRAGNGEQKIARTFLLH